MSEKGVSLKRYPWVLLLAGLLLLIPLVSVVAFGQDYDVPYLYTTKGKVIAEGNNSEPAGHYKVKTYRIEEIEFPKPVRFNFYGRNIEVNSAYKVTITGGPFPQRALIPILWIDDTPLKGTQYSVDFSEMTAIVFDRSLLRDGAKISFSFGEEDPAHTTLPEKLNFKKGGDQR